jgi:hypothetical protein
VRRRPPEKPPHRPKGEPSPNLKAARLSALLSTQPPPAGHRVRRLSPPLLLPLVAAGWSPRPQPRGRGRAGMRSSWRRRGPASRRASPPSYRGGSWRLASCGLVRPSSHGIWFHLLLRALVLYSLVPLVPSPTAPASGKHSFRVLDHSSLRVHSSCYRCAADINNH